MPSPTTKKLQARVEDLKALNKQLKNTIKQLNANIKSLSEARRRTELQAQASLAQAAGRVAAGAHSLRKPCLAIAVVQGELEEPARDKFSRKAASRIKRALTAAARGLDSLEKLADCMHDQRGRTQDQRSGAQDQRGGAQAPDDAPPAAALPLPAARPRRRRRPAPAQFPATAPLIYVIDNDAASLDAILPALEGAGYAARTFADSAQFADAYQPGREICIIVSASTPDMSGIELIGRLQATNFRLPPILLSGDGGVKMIRAATKAGAAGFVEKPLQPSELLLAITRAVEGAPELGRTPRRGSKTAGEAEKTPAGDDKHAPRREPPKARLATLSKRERQVLALVIEGHPSKNIAADLGVSQRTIENHRASIMRKMGAKSLAQLVRLVLAKK